LGYRVIRNPITGRRKKSRVALSYEEYVKARSKTLKKTSRIFNMRSSLQQKYLDDIEQVTVRSRKALDQKRAKLKINGVRANILAAEDVIRRQDFETLIAFDEKGKEIVRASGTVNKGFA
jgi:hypothetical protein